MKKKSYLCIGVLLTAFFCFIVSGCNNGNHAEVQVAHTAQISESAVSAEEDSDKKMGAAEETGDSCYFDEKTGTLTFDGVGKCGKGGGKGHEEGFDLEMYGVEWRKKVEPDRVKEVVIGDGITWIGYL